MKAPGYRWTCHKCDEANDPGLSACARCGFPAISTARDIAAAKREADPTREGYKAMGRGTGWLMNIVSQFL